MSQKVFALCGLGGIGKTQIAIKFAKEHMDSYQVVLFAHADEITSLLEDFSRFAADLGIVDADAPNQQSSSDSLRKWLETTGKISSR
jgi:KaiC/GvpD/RAD55 family RecA-like ATPase